MTRDPAADPAPQPHPTDLELVTWVDGDMRGSPEHGVIARHVIACKRCAGLLLRQTEAGHADAAYRLLSTSWREFRP